MHPYTFYFAFALKSFEVLTSSLNSGIPPFSALTKFNRSLVIAVAAVIDGSGDADWGGLSLTRPLATGIWVYRRRGRCLV